MASKLIFLMMTLIVAVNSKPISDSPNISKPEVGPIVEQKRPEVEHFEMRKIPKVENFEQNTSEVGHIESSKREVDHLENIQAEVERFEKHVTPNIENFNDEYTSEVKRLVRDLNSQVKNENSDDLETAAGTNVLRPLFVYRQQVAYRERVRKAGRRAAPNF